MEYFSAGTAGGHTSSDGGESSTGGANSVSTNSGEAGGTKDSETSVGGSTSSSTAGTSSTTIGGASGNTGGGSTTVTVAGSTSSSTAGTSSTTIGGASGNVGGIGSSVAGATSTNSGGVTSAGGQSGESSTVGGSGGAHELVQQIAAGDGFTCALTATGAVKCWGAGPGLGDGQPVGNSATRLAAVGVVGLSSGVKRLVASGGLACAIERNDQVVCWGINSYGDLDTDAGTITASSVPVALRGAIGTAIDLSVTNNLSEPMDHGCVVDSAFNISCWVSNRSKQLGVEGINSSGAIVTSPALTGFKSVASGGGSGSDPGFTCGLTLSGGVMCWGDNSAGRLGIGAVDGGLTLTTALPMQTVGLESGVVQIVASGRGTTCALTTAGAVKCWGEGSYGALPVDPNRETSFSTTPLTIDGLGTVKQLAAGLMHYCALGTDGTMKCWGYDQNGQLGDQPANITINLYRSTPVDVIGVSDIVTIGAGSNQTCAAPSTGGVLCWGKAPATGAALGTQILPSYVSGL